MEKYSKEKIPAEITWIRQLFRYRNGMFLLAEEENSQWTKEEAEVLLDGTGATLFMSIGRNKDAVTLRCISKTSQVRALEFLDFCVGEYSMPKGDEKEAQAVISELLLKVWMSETDISERVAFFGKRAHNYFTECKVLNGTEFKMQCPEYPTAFKPYVKKHVSWAYVKTTDIAAAGSEVRVKTLENDTGITITVADDLYIMIGCMGEVYEITRQKFETSYEPSDEPLDIFMQMMDFIPAVELPADHSYVTIDELAYLCYPKPGTGILACRLEKRTKVFGKTRMDYFVGKPGDYLAVRPDDQTDIYIIQKEIFERTYERVE